MNLSYLNKLKNTSKGLLIGLSITVLSVATFTGIVNNNLFSGPSIVKAEIFTPYTSLTGGQGAHVALTNFSESLGSNGEYRLSFTATKGANNTAENISLLLVAEKYRCAEGHGQNTSSVVRYVTPIQENLGCWTPWEDDQYIQLNLNAGNNFTQSVTVTSTQKDRLACGSFQTDIWGLSLNGQNINEGNPSLKRKPEYTFNFNGQSFPNAKILAASVSFTGKNLDSCQPVPSPSPSPSPRVSPSVSPSPRVSPSPSQSTIQCPVGHIQKVENSTIVCVAQNQEQTQTQNQNNNQEQTVNNNANATGGSSSSSSTSSSSVNVTVNNPTPAPSPSATSTSVVNVVSQAQTEVKQLPKTGLPLAGWALASLLPVGVTFKRFGKKSDSISANSIWMERQLS